MSLRSRPARALALWGTVFVASCGGHAAPTVEAPRGGNTALRAALDRCETTPVAHSSTRGPSGDPRARAGAQKGLTFLGREAMAWQEKNDCYGCHVQAVTLEAMVVGKTHAFEVEDRAFAKVLDGMLTVKGGARGEHGLTVGGSPGHLSETSRAFGGAAFAHFDEAIDQRVREDLIKTAKTMLKDQEADGSLRESYENLPVAAGRVQATTQGAITFRQAHARTADDAWLEPLRRAEGWLRKRAGELAKDEAPRTQDVAYALMGLVASGAGADEPAVAELARRLTGRQDADGGWGFAKDQASNPYATGQVLYALRRWGMSDGSPTLAKGTSWLLDKQQESGGWSESGFGKAEAMWGVLGLVSVDVVSLGIAGISDGGHVGDGVELVADAKDNGGAGVSKVEIWVDDLLAGGSCGSAAKHRLAGDLSSGRHIVDVVATSKDGRTSKRRLEVWAGDASLAEVGSRFVDGGTRISARYVAPTRPGAEVELSIFTAADLERSGTGAKAIHASKVPAEQGPVAFHWNGAATGGAAKSEGPYVAVLRAKSADGRVLQEERHLFVNQDPEAAKQRFGEVEGQLNLEAGGGVAADVVGANAQVELVDERGVVVQRATTTRSGEYRFKNVEAGKYKVRAAKKAGFADAEAPVEARPAAAPSRVDMDMKRH
jgi:hypothetical protein